jgi:hypothetical protein
MRTITHTMIVCALIIVAACHSTKKNKTSEAPAPVANAPAGPARSSDGIFEPGEPELNALIGKYPDLSLQTLKNGHALYTGECTRCHGAKNIYRIETERWPGIIENMAHKAKFNDVQKDAVFKYVMSVKATQPG